MTPTEMELELSGLRQELTLVNTDDDARRRKARLVARGNLVVAIMFLVFSLALYLDNDGMYLPAFLGALTLIFVGASVMALAEPRTTGR